MFCQHFSLLFSGSLGFLFYQPNGPAEAQCEFFWPDFWVEFWKVNFGGSLAEKTRIKKFDPRIRVQNLGVQNSFRRARLQIRNLNPLCRNLSLIFCSVAGRRNRYIGGGCVGAP